ncbi:hypothetical protein AKI39_01995 [Bordetella sp. H567]|uniref:hypothetical protein n=1 Tax=Bordetella sp. H567 TaxID=1697043 RepID=UPI00081CAC6E|nr:hypothetical protein [Bordetella sp. H567]AOB29717.1 hypothetical protein AKI39_01995 [Bordetella sp. H567]
MSTHILSRRVGVLLFLALVAGCSSTKPSPGTPAKSATSSKSPSAAAAKVGDACASNRRKCIYEGSYESGERNYAEQEAKRLNMAELERLRRSFGN